MGQYRHHVFVCTGKHCRKTGAEDVHHTLKRCVKDAGLRKTVRVNEAGCMNQCGHGPIVVVYPQDQWYAYVDERGARRIADEHLNHDHVVEPYRYVAPPGDNKR